MIETKFHLQNRFNSVINQMVSEVTDVNLSRMAHALKESAKETGFLGRENVFIKNQGIYSPMAPGLRVLRDFGFPESQFPSEEFRRQKLTHKIKQVGRDFSRIFSYAEEALLLITHYSDHPYKYKDKMMPQIYKRSENLIRTMIKFSHDMSLLHAIPVMPLANKDLNKVLKSIGKLEMESLIKFAYGDVMSGDASGFIRDAALLLKSQVDSLRNVILTEDSSIDRISVYYFKFTPSKLQYKKSIDRILGNQLFTKAWYSHSLMSESMSKMFVEEYLRDSRHYSQ